MIVDYAPTANRNAKRIHDFSKEIRNRELEKTFSLYHLWRLQSLNGKLVIPEDIVEDLSQTIFNFKAGIGIESLTEKDQEYLHKKYSLDNLFRASEAFDKYGAILRGFFMITPETTSESIKSCQESKILSKFDDLRVTHLVPFPGTPLYNGLDNGLINKNWSDYDCQQQILKSNYLTDEQLVNAQKDIMQGFLFNKYRQLRLKEKLRRFPQLEKGVNRYHEKMREFNYETLEV